MRYCITGCGGFIGSNLTDRLLALGHEVIGIDNFSTGMRKFLDNARSYSTFKLIECDLLDLEELKKNCVTVILFFILRLMRMCVLV